MEIEKNSRNFLDSAEAERRKRPLLHSDLIFGFPVSRVRKANYNRASVTMVGIVRQSFVPEIGPEKGGLRFHVAPKFAVGILLFLWPIFTLFPCKFNFIYLDDDILITNNF
ncbi:hypothetical protein ALC56_13366 [Trachymyrmex septentrionalis]|uniref:Uncharacterized protein n=1 Tax=Trachymyrmex septentrionalis TaxID=34720 RepID=A0A195EW96_9HYME|nr:hypothetical protein ALC56_13366 [Trachymyrmex septentrionalis]